ncbi:MAG: YdaS family helix-turn-helix protein [Burkholderia gladioli]
MDTPNTSPNAYLDQAIAHFPSLAAMARELGLSGYQVIQEWRRQGRVPAEHCPEVEKRTGILCEKLNGKVDWAYLRSTRPAVTEPIGEVR